MITQTPAQSLLTLVYNLEEIIMRIARREGFDRDTLPSACFTCEWNKKAPLGFAAMLSGESDPLGFGKAISVFLEKNNLSPEALTQVQENSISKTYCFTFRQLLDWCACQIDEHTTRTGRT